MSAIAAVQGPGILQPGTEQLSRRGARHTDSVTTVTETGPQHDHFPTNQANYLSFYYRQQGTPLWTSDGSGKSYATVDSAKKWLQMWADMRAEGLIPNGDITATYAETGADSSALVAGKAAVGLI